MARGVVSTGQTPVGAMARSFTMDDSPGASATRTTGPGGGVPWTRTPANHGVSGAKTK